MIHATGRTVIFSDHAHLVKYEVVYINNSLMRINDNSIQLL